jgi:hypothetical protein
MTTDSIKRTSRILVLGLASGVAGLLIFGSDQQAMAVTPTTVGLGTADSYNVLAGTTVTNSGATVVNIGDVGLSSGTAITGFPPGIINNGVIHAADAQAEQAQTDLTTAYNDAAGTTLDNTVPEVDLGNQVLQPGVYSGDALSLTGTVTLNGDASSVFIFQAVSALITASASTAAFAGGANHCNVFWQVGSSATLGSNSAFAGTIIALQSISANTGTTIDGRLLARDGAVTLLSNVITRSPTARPAPQLWRAARLLRRPHSPKPPQPKQQHKQQHEQQQPTLQQHRRHSPAPEPMRHRISSPPPRSSLPA